MPHHGGTGISLYDSSSNDLCPISLLPFITKLLYLLSLIPLLSLSPGLPGIMLSHSTGTCSIQETNNFYFVKSSGQFLVLRTFHIIDRSCFKILNSNLVAGLKYMHTFPLSNPFSLFSRMTVITKDTSLMKKFLMLVSAHVGV